MLNLSMVLSLKRLLPAANWSLKADMFLPAAVIDTGFTWKLLTQVQALPVYTPSKLYILIFITSPLLTMGIIKGYSAISTVGTHSSIGLCN